MKFERILIVGFGSIGRRHYEIAKQLFPSAEIMVLRTSGLNKPLEWGQFSTIEQALIFKPDISVICCPASLHGKFSLPLASIGSHLMIEKPIETDLMMATRLANFAEHNLVIQVGYNLRFSKALNFFRKKIMEGLVGNILSVRAEVGQYLPSWRSNCDYKKSVSSSSQLGGGVLFELSHEIDYLLWMFGMPQEITANYLKVSDLSIDVEDCAHLIMHYMNIEQSFMVRLDLDFIRHDTRRICEVIGSQGTLQCDLLSGKVNFWQSGKKEWDTIFCDQMVAGETYLAEWDAFIKSINTSSPPLVGVDDGIRVLQVVLAAKKSNTINKKVSLDNLL